MGTNENPEAAASGLRTLEASDIANLMDGRTDRARVPYETHALASSGLIRLARQNSWIHRRVSDLERRCVVQLGEQVLHWETPERISNLVLAHAERAEVTPDGRISMTSKSGNARSLPRLCRPAPLAAIINGLIRGDLQPDDPHRPTCRTCANLGPDNRCTLQPDGAPAGPCCPNNPNQDWCERHRQKA